MERLAKKEQTQNHGFHRGNEEESDPSDSIASAALPGDDVSTNLKSQKQEPPKIGKLRVMKSGRIVMRLQMPGQDEYVDLELNKGINPNFY